MTALFCQINNVKNRIIAHYLATARLKSRFCLGLPDNGQRRRACSVQRRSIPPLAERYPAVLSLWSQHPIRERVIATGFLCQPRRHMFIVGRARLVPNCHCPPRSVSRRPRPDPMGQCLRHNNLLQQILSLLGIDAMIGWRQEMIGRCSPRRLGSVGHADTRRALKWRTATSLPLLVDGLDRRGPVDYRRDKTTSAAD